MSKGKTNEKELREKPALGIWISRTTKLSERGESHVQRQRRTESIPHGTVPGAGEPEGITQRGMSGISR